MGVKIKTVSGNSGYLDPGDEITAINGKRVEDQLDILFNMEEEGQNVLEIRKKGEEELEIEVNESFFEREGIKFREMEFRTCASKCIFCFVDQMPPGLRHTLYCKDDDYRLSFLYGNYITLNDISEKDLNRIIEYNLSPLYVSVHAVDRVLREHIFGRPIKKDIRETLERLTEQGITVHAQIVLVPGVNSGPRLTETVESLAKLYPGCRSLSIVPVGLTRYRDNLPDISSFTAEEGEKIFRWKERMDEKLSIPDIGEGRFYYLSDEFYFMTGRELPPDSYYGDYSQIDNGVGMSRLFIRDTADEIERIRSLGAGNADITVITGTLGRQLIDRYIMPMVKREIPDYRIQVIEVENILFGREVTVSGLLAGSDIIRAAREADNLCDRVVLPPNAVGQQGILIDNTTVEEIEIALERNIIVPESSFLERCVTEY